MHVKWVAGTSLLGAFKEPKRLWSRGNRFSTGAPRIHQAKNLDSCDAPRRCSFKPHLSGHAVHTFTCTQAKGPRAQPTSRKQKYNSDGATSTSCHVTVLSMTDTRKPARLQPTHLISCHKNCAKLWNNFFSHDKILQSFSCFDIGSFLASVCLPLLEDENILRSKNWTNLRPVGYKMKAVFRRRVFFFVDSTKRNSQWNESQCNFVLPTSVLLNQPNRYYSNLIVTWNLFMRRNPFFLTIILQLILSSLRGFRHLWWVFLVFSRGLTRLEYENLVFFFMRIKTWKKVLLIWN